MDCKKFEQNNKKIALNILYVPHNTREIRPARISKYNFKRDNQVVLLMITNNEKWHYLAVKNISMLLRRVTSNHNGDFYCLNCFHSYRTLKKLKKHAKVCQDHDFCNVIMPDRNNNILKYDPKKNSLEVSNVFYADFECELKKIDSCQKNPEKSYTQKKSQA